MPLTKRIFILALIITLSICIKFNSHKKRKHFDQLDINSLRQSQLQRHNQLRAIHGCPPLQLDDRLNDAAQAYSQKRLSQQSNQHSPQARSGQYGQNLFWAWGSPTYTYKPGTASQDWYNEVQDYDYSTAKSINGKAVGHFTAMIWKSATTVGFGYAYGRQNNGYAIYVTANYGPITNMVGQYQQNVPQPVNGQSGYSSTDNTQQQQQPQTYTYYYNSDDNANNPDNGDNGNQYTYYTYTTDPNQDNNGYDYYNDDYGYGYGDDNQDYYGDQEDYYHH